ncbi:hypothetical protein [Streptosporangium lutulentum]|uniref:Dihydrofolate reductase n=1 Tax=Streptosporangium lutulentum TaxID=1461250 RepID=A0ABT9QIA1_9ACTN|nr:hypothetical protein [Streptosporangium lutulentum]MDP9846111.1 dihydrofolate reductase [Streptosporangium lutulentum]
MGLVRDLKQRDGTGIRLCGGGKPAARLLGEIDEPVIKRNPIVLGITLFDGPFAPSPFTLTATRSFDGGVAITTYVKH